jgi:4-diphosphocytidyl-2-C-methyl-D-erythritol kinase
LNVRPLKSQRVASPYHKLTTVMHLIELADEITWGPADEFGLSCSGQGLDDLPLEDNLAWKAAQLYAAASGRELPAIHIHIEKHIPVGAGLAGGSADAAAVLSLLSDGPGAEGPSPSALAAELGSDVPFFLADNACCLMGGTGSELLRELPPAAGVPVVVAWDASEPVATSSVYAAFDDHALPVDETGEAALVGALDGADVERIGPHLYNNLSAAAFTVSSAARRVNELLSASPLSTAVALSGSGGASFSLCGSAEDASILADKVRAVGFSACATELARQKDRRQ